MKVRIDVNVVGSTKLLTIKKEVNVNPYEWAKSYVHQHNAIKKSGWKLIRLVVTNFETTIEKQHLWCGIPKVKGKKRRYKCLECGITGIKNKDKIIRTKKYQNKKHKYCGVRQNGVSKAS